MFGWMMSRWRMMCSVVVFLMVAPVVLAAPELDPEVKVQILAALSVAIPFVVELTKKLNIPEWLNPVMPLLLGIAVCAGLAAGGVIPVTIWGGVLIGLGVGATSGSGFAIVKKIKKSWNGQ